MRFTLLVVVALIAAINCVLSVTTPHDFKKLFKNACKSAFMKRYGKYEKGCSKRWNTFSKVFAYQDLKKNEKIEAFEYLPYLQMDPPAEHENEVFFFTGTGWVVNQLQGIYSSNDMFAVDIMNRLKSLVTMRINKMKTNKNKYRYLWLDNKKRICWCGNKYSEDGIEYKQNCPSNVCQSFWGGISIQLARYAAKGKAFWLANGLRKYGAFDEDTDFVKYELPNLKAGQVTELVVILLCARRSENKGKLCDTVLPSVRKKGPENIRYLCYNLRVDVDGKGSIITETSKVAGKIQKLRTLIIEGMNLNDQQHYENPDCRSRSYTKKLSSNAVNVH